MHVQLDPFPCRFPGISSSLGSLAVELGFKAGALDIMADSCGGGRSIWVGIISSAIRSSTSAAILEYSVPLGRKMAVSDALRLRYQFDERTGGDGMRGEIQKSTRTEKKLSLSRRRQNRNPQIFRQETDDFFLDLKSAFFARQS